MLEKFCEMAGEPSRSIKCDIMTCDSEMDTANRNYALLHYMKDMRVSQLTGSGGRGRYEGGEGEGLRRTVHSKMRTS